MVTSRRRWFVIAAFLIFAGSVGLYFVLPGCPVTRQNAAKIQPGMAKQQVEALLGGPPADYSSGLYEPVLEDLNGGWLDRREWVGKDTAVLVWFDDQHKVAFKRPREVQPVNQGFWAWLRRLLMR